MSIPRILIAGSQSHVGKTSLTLALVAALKKRGLKIQTFKVGPDFLDPTHLAIASARPCYNLDGWMCEPDYLERLFNRVTQGADLAVVEGVMGLYDGIGDKGLSGSTAEIAARFKTPVLLVVNVHGMAGSLAALVAGYDGFNQDIHLTGVIANFIGSDSHATLLRNCLESAGLPGLVGAVPRGSLPELEGRHLGLVTADAGTNLGPQVLDALAHAAETHLSLNEILRLARSAPPLDRVFETLPPQPEKIRLALAHDQAFHFYYQDLLDELELRGCGIVRFSPLTDTALPADIHGLFLGGGYPEEHAEALAANQPMLQSIRRFAGSGRPVYAECGGLIYLCRAVMDRQGRKHSLLGLVPAEARMREHKKFLGYVEVCLKQDGLWGRAGDRLRGHEFHYSELVMDPDGPGPWRPAYGLTGRRSGMQRDDGLQAGAVLAGYAHLHLAGRPRALECFMNFLTGTREKIK